MIRIISVLLFNVVGFLAFADTPKITIEEYVETWKDVAIAQMKSHKIPASITLAQAILESGFGNSMLAMRANNHFGIKCHDWTGKTFLKDDDAKNECFRKYSDASESFEDHCEFLTSRSRYVSLFELEITDYKGWAKGLKDAGYATSPTYDKKLIDLIERYNLNQYDYTGNNEWIANKPVVEQNQGEFQNPFISKHKVLTTESKTKYVVAGKHDTFYLISKEFGVTLKQLGKWNNFPATKDVLKEGDKIYIMRNKES